MLPIPPYPYAWALKSRCPMTTCERHPRSCFRQHLSTVPVVVRVVGILRATVSPVPQAPHTPRTSAADSNKQNPFLDGSGLRIRISRDSLHTDLGRAVHQRANRRLRSSGRCLVHRARYGVGVFHQPVAQRHFVRQDHAILLDRSRSAYWWRLAVDAFEYA